MGMIAKWVNLDLEPELEIGNQYVYVGDFVGAVKIGISMRPDERLRTIESSAGRSLISGYILVAQEPYNALLVEAQLHKAYNSFRGRGEWFTISAASVVSQDVEVKPITSVLSRTEVDERRLMEFAYYYGLVATPSDVHRHRQEAVRTAAVPLMASFLVALAKICKASGENFVITGDMSDGDMFQRYAELIEAAGPRFIDTGLEVDRIALDASPFGLEEFLSSRDGISTKH